MYKCTDCGQEHAKFVRSDGESLCETCAYKNYDECVQCGKFVDPDNMGSSGRCIQCSK